MTFEQLEQKMTKDLDGEYKRSISLLIQCCIGQGLSVEQTIEELKKSVYQS